MSEEYNFSPSLTESLQRCINAAKPDEQNKWFKEFGHVTLKLKPTVKTETKNVIDLCDTPDITEKSNKDDNIEVTDIVQKDKDKLTVELDALNLEELVESLETELRSNFDFMIEESCKNNSLLPLLADRLATPTIEKLCSQIYEVKNINRSFLHMFFEYFLPNYIKRAYNSSTLDILIRGNKTYPLEFKILLTVLVKDFEIPNKVLQDYVLTLNECDRSKFILDLSDLDLSTEEFVNNLFSIYSAYKDCKKSFKIQEYIQSLITQYSSMCICDKNYGRLFLAYLQAQKSVKSNVNYENLEMLLEVHRSAFKRPCLTLLKELTNLNKGDEVLSDDDSD